MITRGLEAASKGMQALIQYEDVIANNVANINTTAFKRTNIAFKNIMDTKVEQRSTEAGQGKRNVGTLSLGSMADRTYIDFSQGALNQTGSKLDVAIEGEGFFKVRVQNTINEADNEKNYYYTRNGNFHLTQDHYLVNKLGDYVMDENNKRIRLVRNPEDPKAPNPTTRIDLDKELIVGEDGLIQVIGKDGSRGLGKIQIVDFEDKTKMSTVGDGKYLPIEGQDPKRVQAKSARLQQGFLEGANANTVNEMIQSINVSRSYETLAKIVKTQGETVSQAIELGKIKG